MNSPHLLVRKQYPLVNCKRIMDSAGNESYFLFSFTLSGDRKRVLFVSVSVSVSNERTLYGCRMLNWHEIFLI